MADIVKMGKSHFKASSTAVVSNETSYSAHNVVELNASHHMVKHPHASGTLLAEPCHDLHSSQDAASKVSVVIHESDSATSQHVSQDDSPLVEQSAAASGPSVSEVSAASEVYADPSDLHGLLI